MTIGLFVALFFAIGAALSIYTISRLLPRQYHRDVMSPDQGPTGASSDVATKQEVEALREAMLQLRFEFSESRREVAEIRREQGGRPSPRDLDLVDRRKRADERPSPVVDFERYTRVS